MRRNRPKIKLKKPPKVHYTERKPLFSDKEIIFRSGGRAKVFNISSRLQLIVLTVLVCVGAWSAYSYHLYNKSDTIISEKDEELTQTRGAYVDLMTDFVAVHRNISSMFNLIDQNKIKDDSEINRYKQQAQVVEDKIKKITDTADWVDGDTVEKQTTLRDALLQRDRALSERDELLSKISRLEKNLNQMENSDQEILNRLERFSDKEIGKIKDAISTINKSIKKQSRYFNPLANSKKNNIGGVYVPMPTLENEALSARIQTVLKQVDDVAYMREVLKAVPLGKPVWSYWLTSPFGHRSDPFNKKSAAHKGVDLASNRGNKVRTMAAGRVTRAEVVNGYGNFIEIDHGNGFKTRYAHLNKSYVKKGQRVTKNDAIAEVGSTGRSTGPHLHYEVLYNGANVDPMTFIKIQI
jgi:murein DD-endopeptidase MepM/ murein hydrolase activator NlpD